MRERESEREREREREREGGGDEESLFQAKLMYKVQMSLHSYSYSVGHHIQQRPVTQSYHRVVQNYRQLPKGWTFPLSLGTLKL